MRRQRAAGNNMREAAKEWRPAPLNFGDGYRRKRLTTLPAVEFGRREGESAGQAARRLLEIWDGCSGVER